MTIKSLSLITATLLLTTNVVALEDIGEITVVSATKSSQNIKEVTSNVDVITAQEIEERGYTTVTQALNSLAGVSFNSNGGLGQNTSLYLRGMSTNRTLVLIDGIRYNDVTSPSGAAYAHLMVGDIAQIEVVKGAQSGIWGADASAGVINIVTKKAQPGVHGSFYAEAGSFKTNKVGGDLSYSNETFYFKVAHNYLKTDGFSAFSPNEDDLDKYEDDGYRNNTTNIQAGLQINENNKIDITHTIINAKVESDPYDMDIGAVNPNGEYNSEVKDTFSSVNFNHIDSFNELNIYAKNSKFDREYLNDLYSPNFDGNVREYGINSKIPYRNEDFALVGIDYKKFEHENDIDETYNNKGIFITNSNTFKGFMGGKTILTESIRYDRYSAFENKTTGKIGLKHIHEEIEGLITSINYGTAYNVPTLYQLYSPYGSKELNPEETKSFDVTVEYKDFTLTYFDTKIDDMIDFDMTTYTYGNIAGTSKINGLEVAYKITFFDTLLVNMNYTHLFKAQDKDGEDLRRRAKDNFKIALDYYGIENLHLGVDAEYVGSRTDTGNSVWPAPAPDVETGKYAVVNMTANYDITKQIEVYAKIENITDEYYQTVYNYSSSPRAFYAGVRAKF
jgi:vitamin B12 transporter